MNEINQNNASEFLTLYMDGELDSSLVEGFEAELANNPELQSEYSDLLAIREAVQKDVKKLIPPYESTATIFESLGISYTSSISSTTSVGMSVWQQLFVPIMASLSAAIVTVGAYVGINIENTNPVDQNRELTQKESLISSLKTAPVIAEENINEEIDENIQQNNISENKSDNNSTFIKSNNSRNIISNRSSIPKIIKNIVEPVQEQNIEQNRTIAKNIIVNDEVFFSPLYPSNIIEKTISMFNIGQSSKFDFGYNKQQLEYINSNFKRNSGGLIFNQSGARLSYTRNIISENKLTHYITGFSLNAGSNLFNNNFAVLDNIYIGGDILLVELPISNIIKVTPLAGVAYDLTSSSPLFRLGTNIEIPTSSAWTFEGRIEYNSLLKTYNSYDQMSIITGLVGIKIKF